MLLDRPALSRCTHRTPAEFAELVWGREPSLSRAHELDQPFDDLFSLEVVDDLVSRRGLRTPFLRVARAGTTLPSARFTRPGGVGAGIDDQVDDVALARLFADGATIVLQGMHRVHAPLIDFAQQLSTDLGHPVQVNAYVTPPQSQGFSDHYDVHHVFVLQVAGTKRWRIRPPVHQHPLRDQPWTQHRAEVERAAQEEPLLDVVLAPGDALYLPAGYLHAARALGETSAHLTIGVHAWTRRHLLDRVLTALADVEALREPLPLGIDVTDPAQVATQLQQSLGALREVIDTVDPAAVAGAMAAARATSQRAEPVAPLAQSRLLASLGGATKLRWRRHLPATLTETPEGLRLQTADGSVTLSRAAGPAVRRLVDGETLAAADLGLDAARLLVRAALVRGA